MAGAGAERVVVTTLQHLSRHRFEPHLAVCELAGAHLGDVPRDVPIHDLKKRSAASFPALVWRFARLAAGLRPDAVISHIWYTDAIQLLARRLSADRRWLAICVLHNVTDAIERERFGRAKLALLRSLYPSADACWGVSGAVVDDFQSRLSLRGRPPVDVQYNPWELDEVRLRAAEPPPLEWSAGETQLLGIGRLTPQKAWHVLIEALATVGRDLPWRLTLLGEGALEDELKAQARRVGLADRIHFAGYVHNPYPLIRRADLMVLSSVYEGLPSVLIEALALQTPVLATDSPGGTAEVLGHGRYGMLVPAGDAPALAEALRDLLTSPEAREALGRQAAEGAARFEVGRVMSEMEARLDALWGG